MKKIIMVAMFIVSGCVPLADLSNIPRPEPEITISTDEFNESTKITMSPDGAWCHSPVDAAGFNIRFGFEYNTYHPNSIAVVMTQSKISTFLDLSIKINGKKRTFETGRNYRDIQSYVEYYGYPTSTTSRVIIPYDLFEEMMTADKVLLRVDTTHGYSDCDFAIEEKYWKANNVVVKMARFYAKDFLQSVRSIKKVIKE